MTKGLNKRVGVVIATYNGEKYILDQLKSIVNQTQKPDLIVISDGCSTDGTLKIAKNYLDNTNIKYLLLKSDERLGVKENFEKGLIKCDTNYIFFSDQDDYWLQNKIKDTMEIIEKEHPIVVFTNATITDEFLKPYKKSLWNKVGYKPNDKVKIYNKCDFALQKELIKHNIMTGMCMCIDSQIKDKIMPISDYSIHDIWIAHASNCIGKVISLNKEEVLYRQHTNNVIGAKRNLKNSFMKKDNYLTNIKNRYLFIEDINNRFELSDDYKKNYIKYQFFLKERINFIEHKKFFLSLFFMIPNYYKYEYKPLSIIIKDLYTRLKYKRGVCEYEFKN